MFSKTVQSEVICSVVNGLYNSSLLGNSCLLFEELDQISNEMANGSRVKICQYV